MSQTLEATQEVEPESPDQNDNGTSSAAVRKPEVPTSWEEIFDHPRFKQLAKRAQTAEEKLLEVQKAEADRERKALEEQGKWQELAERRAQEIAELKKSAGRVETYEEALAEVLEAQKKDLPKESLNLIPESLSVPEQLKWLTSNIAFLRKEAAPADIGNRRRSLQPATKTNVTEEEKAIAKRFGLSIEEYTKWRANALEEKE